jgi:hypothetical protein
MSKPAPRNLRVVIFCLGIETVKHIAPLKYFGADKAYMLYLERKSLFQVFRTEVSKQANKILREGLVEVEVKVYDFTKTMACLLEIVKKEKAAGNIVYMNLDGPPNYAAAAMITAMMEDCETFYTPTADHQITDIKMFQDAKGNLIGLSKEVTEPVLVPKFQLRMPPEDLVKGLRVWKERKFSKKLMKDALMVEDLEKKDLMGIHNGSGATQSAKMYYRRHFLDEWVKLGWLEKDGADKYAMTEKGEVAVRVFYLE